MKLDMRLGGFARVMFGVLVMRMSQMGMMRARLVVDRVFLPLGGSKSETTWDLERRLLDELIA